MRQIVANIPRASSRGDLIRRRTGSPLSAGHPLVRLHHLMGNAGVQRLAQGPVVQRAPQSHKDRDWKKIVEDCARQDKELLPGGVGAVELVNREVTLTQLLGNGQVRQAFEQEIKDSYKAREFVCEAGVPAIMALFYNKDYKSRLDVDRARASLDAHPELYTNAAFDTAQHTKAALQKTFRITIEPGDKSWSNDDITLLAEALGRMSDQEKALIAGYRFLRWSNKCFHMQSKQKDYDCTLEDWATCGLHLPDVIRGDYTITLYDCYKTDPEEFKKKKFLGSAGAETIVHEIGHAMEYGRRRVAIETQRAAKREYERLSKLAAKATGSAKQSLDKQAADAKGALDAADKGVSAALSPSSLDQFEKLTKGQPLLTPYSAKNSTEAFAEAYMLFKVAPKKLAKANKKLFEWFTNGGFL